MARYLSWTGWARSLGAMLAVVLSVGLAPAQDGSRPRSTAIRTPDFDASVTWYRDKLGFRLLGVQTFVPGRTAVMERNGFLLEVTEVDHSLAQAREPQETGGVQVTPVPVISLLVPDVDTEIERLEAAGVDVLQAPEDELNGTYRTAQIRDNGRHRIELREPLGSGSFNATGR